MDYHQSSKYSSSNKKNIYILNKHHLINHSDKSSISKTVIIINGWFSTLKSSPMRASWDAHGVERLRSGPPVASAVWQSPVQNLWDHVHDVPTFLPDLPQKWMIWICGWYYGYIHIICSIIHIIHRNIMWYSHMIITFCETYVGYRSNPI